jgi:hypothetical protein
MPDFVISYHGGKQPSSPEEGVTQMARWKAWVEGLGDAVVNPGTPLGRSKTVSTGGVSDGSESRLTGFSIVKAANMDVALEMARKCPFLDMGTVEVAQVMDMPG